MTDLSSRRRRTSAGLAAALTLAGGGVLTPSAVAAPGGAGAAPTGLAVAGVVDPLGIDDTTPDLQWRTPASVDRQTAFEVRVASSADRLARGDLWRSGRVKSSVQAVEYAGDRLDSRDRAVWQVRVWSERGGVSAWSAPASFEMGLLEESAWEGEWITDPRWDEALHQDVAVGSRTTRYVRIRVIDLGRPEEPLDDPAWKPRLELGEIELVDGGGEAVNVAEGAEVTVSEENSEPGVWEPRFLTDGKVTTADAPRGYRSDYHEETDVQDRPIVITLDLGEERTFDTVRLYSLWDSPGRYGTTPNFPRDLQVSVSADGSSFTNVGPRTKLVAVSNRHEAPEALPVLARDFSARRDVASARLYVTGMGVYRATVNGEPVSPDVLEPANTQHADRIPYATYDVTDKLRTGDNTWGLELGNGIWNVFNVPSDPSRYVKAAAGHGFPRALGQLEITYRDGTREVVATDEAWDSALGEVTFTNWYGGEDHDARRSLGRWNNPGADRAGWKEAVAVDAPHGGTELVARVNPPIRQVDTLDTVEVTEPKPGVHVFDLGVNFAGWQQLTTSGPAGTKVTMRPGEKLLADGTVDMRSVGGNIRDTFTLAGTGQETFTPRFVYHGFRYLQVEGLTTTPTTDTVKGLVLRASNESVGSFETSDPMMTDIHRIIDRSVQSNMYSVFTDCPHREKLGWLDQTNLVFDTVAYGYDVQAHYRKLLQDVVDAQQQDGLIPTTAPEDALFAGAFRHDANWGATLAVSSWQLYQWYGDDSAIRSHWPAMVDYYDYLSGRAQDGILSGGLGDWITPASPATPPAVTQTWAFKRIATHMAWIAAARGDEAAAKKYEAEAERIAAAFHERFFDDTTGLYGNGDQASQALALEEDMVPADLRQAVLDRFVQMVRAADDHIVVGEIGLHAAVELLSRERLDDVLFDWVQRTDGHSYGSFLKRGSTSLPESWSSANASQNHYMLGAIDAWFTSRVAGIAQAPGSVAWEEVVVEPALVGDVESAAAEYESVRGVISSAWSRKDGELTLRVSVPGNTRAVVRVPVADGGTVRAPAGADEVPSTIEGHAQFEVGPGDHEFRAPLG
ncbi:family 78 glycoside hydrolase catalytic domain [Nocardioides sp. SYSU DS0651]|uniref:family 78 glycoside hydrolase catalytic domain n=1 Tax=Nocardioides sp. SYSU DS0651 TaxID=3415955 RepID=UPI003F4BBC21